MKTRCINVKEVSFPDFSANEKDIGETTVDYTNLLMNVPLNVRVEIGKTKMPMREVLKLAQGSIIKLEKQAGAPVDIIANDQTVARGDVIVIEDNFGVRITEIITSRKFMQDIKAAEEKPEKNETVPGSSPETGLTGNTEEGE
ncbi:MAG: flagellar motor switch protein FliN [Oscillospiraceae bacterium]|nr:flagellar motor switch protein FliN [Oscillospiraceae bacterium]